METKSWINLTIALALVATVLQIVGFSVPMWIYLDVDSFYVAVGLWHSEGCGLEGTCNSPAPAVPFGYDSEYTYDRSVFKAVQVFQTFGLVGAILVAVFVILYRVVLWHWGRMRLLQHAVVWTSIITWVCILMGVFIFCGKYWPVVDRSHDFSAESFPWSLLLCFLAAVLFIVVTILFYIKCMGKKFIKRTHYTSDDPYTVTRYADWPHHHSSKHGQWVYYNEGSDVESSMNRRYLPTTTVVETAEPRRVVREHPHHHDAVLTTYENDRDSSRHRQESHRRFLPTLVVDSEPPSSESRRVTRLEKEPAPVFTIHEDDYDRNWRHQQKEVSRTSSEKNPKENDHQYLVKDVAVVEQPRYYQPRYYQPRYYNDDMLLRAWPYHVWHPYSTTTVVSPVQVVHSVSREWHGTTDLVRRPLVTSHYSRKDPPRKLLLADKKRDPRFTKDGRLMAVAHYQPQYPYHYHGDRDRALDYTTHVAPRHMTYLNQSQPVHLYRPYGGHWLY